MINNSASEIAEKLKKANSVAIFCHARPDGDALGAKSRILFNYPESMFLSLFIGIKNTYVDVCTL